MSTYILSFEVEHMVVQVGFLFFSSEYYRGFSIFFKSGCWMRWAGIYTYKGPSQVQYLKPTQRRGGANQNNSQDPEIWYDIFSEYDVVESTKVPT